MQSYINSDSEEENNNSHIIQNKHKIVLVYTLKIRY